MRIIPKIAAVLVAVLALAFVVAPSVGAAATEPQVLFVNVGKADAAILFLGEQTYLVDTGTADSASVLLAALERYQVRRLDGVFITHTHKDHVGGLKKLLKSDVEVVQLYAPEFSVYETVGNHPVYEQSQKRDIPLQWLNAGDVIEVDEQTSFTVLGPMTRYDSSENNNSLVLYLQTPRGTILLAGDMVVEEEQELLSHGMIPSADVYKVAHHGKDDASGEALIRAVSPQIAIISTSVAEESDTANAYIVNAFREAGAKVLVTQEARVGILVRWQDDGWLAERIN